MSISAKRARIAQLTEELNTLKAEVENSPQAGVKFKTGMALVLTGAVTGISRDKQTISVKMDGDSNTLNVPRSVIEEQYNDAGSKADTWQPRFDTHCNYDNVVTVTPASGYGNLSLTDVSSNEKGWVPFVKALRNAIAINRDSRR